MKLPQEVSYSEESLLDRSGVSAIAQCQLLIKRIKEYESKLKDNQRVVLIMGGYGENLNFFIDEMGFDGSCLIIFNVTLNGIPSTIVQNITQINLVISSIETKEPRKIGIFPNGFID